MCERLIIKKDVKKEPIWPKKISKRNNFQL